MFTITTFITNWKDDRRPFVSYCDDLEKAKAVADHAAENPCFVWARVEDENGRTVYERDREEETEHELFAYQWMMHGF